MDERDHKAIYEELNQPSLLGAVSGSLREDAIEFAECIKTFDALDKKNGFWILEMQISSEELYNHYLLDRVRWRNDR